VKEWAVKFSGEISYWLRLQINDGQTPIEICHKLLKKLGLERNKTDRPGAVQMVDRKGKHGANMERFRVNLDFNPIRTRLLEAARRKHSESITSICNKENLSIQNDVIDLKPPEIKPSPPLKLAPNPENHIQPTDLNQPLGGRTENAPRTA
jgi:hypothetical protein